MGNLTSLPSSEQELRDAIMEQVSQSIKALSIKELSKLHPKCRTCRFSKINKSLGSQERKHVGLCAYAKSTINWFPVEFDVDYCGRHKPE